MTSTRGVSLALMLMPQITEQKRIGPPAFSAGEIFRERIAQTHVDSTFDLARAGFGVDSAADIVRRYYALDPSIFVENHDLGGVAEGHVCGWIRQRFGRTGPGSEVANVVA